MSKVIDNTYTPGGSNPRSGIREEPASVTDSGERTITLNDDASNETGHATEEKKTNSRLSRNLRRALSWRRKKEAGEQPKPAENEAPKTTSKGMKWMKWVKGATLQGSMEATPPTSSTDTANEQGHDNGTMDPTQLYKTLEANLQMARLEETKNLAAAFRLLVRKLHPLGKNITFPTMSVVDRMQLRCVGIPTDLAELKELTRKTLERRGEEMDLEEAYRDLVQAHGRNTFDPTKPSPLSYQHTKRP